MDEHLLEGRLPTFLRIQPIEAIERRSCPPSTKSVGKSGEVEIVACRVPPKYEHALDPQDLLLRWNGDGAAHSFYDDGLQRLLANELPHTCLNAVEVPKDEHWFPNACSLPTGYGLQFRQNLIEPTSKVRDDMVGVTR